MIHMIGSDPGVSGATVYLRFTGLNGRAPAYDRQRFGPHAILRHSKATESELVAFIRAARDEAQSDGTALLATLEIVSGGAWRGRGAVDVCPACKKPKDSGGSQAASFRFGEAYGALRMAFVAQSIDVVRMSPQKWQRLVEVNLSGCGSREERKRALKAEAQAMFDYRFTAEEADAALIALAGFRSLLKGTLADADEG